MKEKQGETGRDGLKGREREREREINLEKDFISMLPFFSDNALFSDSLLFICQRIINIFQFSLSLNKQELRREKKFEKLKTYSGQIFGKNFKPANILHTYTMLNIQRMGLYQLQSSLFVLLLLFVRPIVCPFLFSVSLPLYQEYECSRKHIM